MEAKAAKVPASLVPLLEDTPAAYLKPDRSLEWPLGQVADHDHVQPVAGRGGDGLDNLQPLQWQNNQHQGDNYPQGGTCAVSAV